VVAALRAQWFRGKGQADKIEPLLEPLAEKAIKRFAKNSPGEGKFMLDVGDLYSSLDQQKAAERWYRRVVALQPKAYLPLVSCLAQQGRMKEALELCRETAKSDASATPAIAAAIALVAGKPSAADFTLAEPLLSKAVADHKDDVDLLTAVAGVRVVQERLDEAVGLFRQTLALKPDNLSALNNLATILAEKPASRAEALQHIDRAIDLAGPKAGLLDTKGMILVFENKPADAVPLLEQATTSPLADPRFHFHLAVAYDRTQQAEKARAAFRTACKRHLTSQVLTPSDETMLAELKKKFD
jgi:Flp pilus assembly protein TadD